MRHPGHREQATWAAEKPLRIARSWDKGHAMSLCWLCQPRETSCPTRIHQKRQGESHKGALARFRVPPGLQPSLPLPSEPSCRARPEDGQSWGHSTTCWPLGKRHKQPEGEGSPVLFRDGGLPRKPPEWVPGPFSPPQSPSRSPGQGQEKVVVRSQLSKLGMTATASPSSKSPGFGPNTVKGASSIQVCKTLLWTGGSQRREDPVPVPLPTVWLG